MQRKWVLLLASLAVAVIAAEWGPIMVSVFGGNNKQNTAAWDAQLEWAGAQTAAKGVLGVALATNKLKVGDTIVFQYIDGVSVKLKYNGGYPGNLNFSDPQYSNQVPPQSLVDPTDYVDYCGSPIGMNSVGFLSIESYFWGQRGTVGSDGGVTIEGFRVPVSISTPSWLSPDQLTGC